MCDTHTNRPLLRPQGLGDGRGQAARVEEGQGRARAQARRHPPPHVGRRHLEVLAVGPVVGELSGVFD